MKLGRVNPGWKRLLVLSIFWSTVAGASAVADSDGYFCTGDGYLAYETRWVGESQRHILQIVRFSEPIGIVAVEPLELKDFQTHAMACADDVIRISDFSKAYDVDIRDIEHPALMVGEARSSVSSDGPTGNLGHWSQETVLDLRSGDTEGRFQLVILKASRRGEGGIEHYTVSELIERDRRGDTLRSHRLFSGIFLETVD